MKFCNGNDTHIRVREVEAKAWHDDDLYILSCTKCGKSERCLARRPSQTIMRCGKTEGGTQHKIAVAIEIQPDPSDAVITGLETILNERGAVFDAMVDAAEDAAGKGVSFNVVIGRSLRAALAAAKEMA